MSEIVANRYAEALFEVAEERNSLDAIETQLSHVASVLGENVELLRVLDHPQISANEKKALVGQVFKDSIGSEVVNLLKLLIDKKRESSIHSVLEAYTRMANEKRGLLDATITTAAPLNNEEKEGLVRRLGETFGKKLRVNLLVNPAIIGGILLRIGNRRYDGTISGKLAGFRHEIKVGKQG